VRGRRQTQLGISLFAFQDIIMSVTGVLILIILLLVLELVNQVATDHLQEHYQAIAVELKTEIASLKGELKLLNQELKTDNEAVEQAIKNPQSLLDEHLRSEREQIDQLESRVSSLEKLSEELTAESELQQENRELLDQREVEIAELQLMKDQLVEKLEKLKAQKAVKYKVPKGINPTQAWLCEVDGSGLSLSLLDNFEKDILIPITSWDTEADITFIALKNQLSAINPRVRYVLFLVRPSGRDFNDHLVVQGEELSIEFGIEYIPEDHVILR
tara:strand:- start:1114 stop:1932 length:819 start_codon:yes stop_codon:yes gene_type:complete